MTDVVYAILVFGENLVKYHASLKIEMDVHCSY